MSGVERIGNASAQSTGANESVVCGNVHAESSGKDQLPHREDVHNVPSVGFKSSDEIDPVYSIGVLSEAAEDDGSILGWNLGKCLGESLNPIQNMEERLGILDCKVQADESAGIGIRISNCSTTQQFGGGLNCANSVTEELLVQDGESLTWKAVEDGTSWLNGGVVNVPGNNLGQIGTVGGQLNEDVVKSSCGMEESCNKFSTLKTDDKPKESFITGNSEDSTSITLEGKRVATSDVSALAEQSVSLMQTPTEEQALCHGTHTWESLSLQNPIGQDSVRSEFSDPNVVLPNTDIPEPVCEGSISTENALETQIQNGPTNVEVEFSSYGVPGSCGQRLSSNCKTGEMQHLFVNENMTNLPLEEKNVKQVLNDATVKGNPAEDSWKGTLSSATVDYLLNKPAETSIVAPSDTSAESTLKCSGEEQSPITLGEPNLESLQSEQSAQKEKPSSETGTDDSKEKQNKESDLKFIESTCMDGAKRSLDEMEKSNLGMSKSSGGLGNNSPASSDTKGYSYEQTRPISQEIIEKPHVIVLGIPATTNENARGERRQIKVSGGKMHTLRSSGDCTRTLRSRSQVNSEASRPNSYPEDTKGSSRRRGRKKKREMRVKSHDEFARMRKHLRYLLHRIKYEQNLLDAYSSEGWRGQSIEKLRPEQELQRAKVDINRSKSKIRDLFRCLDSMCAEGKFPDSLYDSEGLIDSEDIFCAKCGSKDLSTNNDIVLCDGACDRGFHQYCLEPPLRTEEIPPGDEGWLCPACDCKVDCLELLNDSQGTKLCIEDSWEKIFPEAAAAVAGREHDDIMGLPSDDSEDNDYNPEGADNDAKVEASDSSSDNSDSAESVSSDFSSASEDLGAVCGNEQFLGLPSEDSEDDDFDPDAVNINEDAEHESSSSDFTSASEEDLRADVGNDQTSGNHEQQPPLLDHDQETDNSSSMSGRRHVERLDYKKLYDETYGNAPSDSSDDEEWTDMHATRKRKSTAEKGGPVSSNVDTSVPIDDTGRVISRRRGRKKLNPQAENGSPARLTKSSQKIGSSGKSMKRSPYQRLGEVVTQRLYESFKENQYPDRETKEKLAKELGLTPLRVDKWFGNARWSLNHHPARIEASMAAAASVSSNTAHTPKISRKRKKTKDDQLIAQSSNRETSLGGTQTESSQSAEAQDGIQRRRKSEA